jgi:hypothetical protein
MSAMSDLWLTIEDYLRFSHLSFDEIAMKLDVPKSWVMEVAEEMSHEQMGS